MGMGRQDILRILKSHLALAMLTVLGESLSS